MTLQTFTVTIGSLELAARAEVVGKFRPAQISGPPERCHPAESPEIDVHELWTLPPAFSDVRRVDMLGLLDDEAILESVHAQILGKLDDSDREGDPDAGDKWRDEQMERNA